MEKLKLGIIGGSGLDNPDLISNYREISVPTIYGFPSSDIIKGEIGKSDIFILARHGKRHEIPPSEVNYKANVIALKDLGCNYILATTAVGSLREEIKPETLVFPSQFIDFTKQRKSTFFSEMGNVMHTQMSMPFDEKLRNMLCTLCDELGFEYHRDKTVITIEGPRFSTVAESKMFQQWGADIINMSTCPEVALANEAGIPYQAIAMSTDYDCWKKGEEPVTWEMILKRMNNNTEKVKTLLVKGIERLVSL
jgi:5'-methylthioadenosine phosphorylase